MTTPPSSDDEANTAGRETRMAPIVEKAKVCLIGATAVGKSSLVARYVRSVFSDEYRTTIGVKIELRRVNVDGHVLDLVLWDLSGEDEFQTVQRAYLRGARGYVLAIDGTRRATEEVAIALEARVRETIGAVPFIVALNKADLAATWELDDEDIEAMKRRGWTVVRVSARTGEGVDALFEELAKAILRGGTPWI